MKKQTSISRYRWICLASLVACVAAGSAQPAKTALPQPAVPATDSASDDHIWLEDVTGEKALGWVRERNSESMKELAESPGFASLKTDLRAILDSRARIPYVSKRGPFYYNFWRDAKNPKGLWRRTTFEEYRKPEPKWDIVIDLDALAKEENENWVWRGAQILKPDYQRCLISLSRGGADASVTREFDLETRSFVAGGFFLPEAKGRMSWIDADHAYVSTDFGPGSLTTSGYPRIAKLWTRGTPLSDAKTVYEGQPTDVSVSASYDDTKGFERHIVSRGIAFYASETFLRKPNGSLAKIEVPEDANPEIHREWMTVELRTPWTVGSRTYPAGALIATRFEDFMEGKRDFTVVYEPTPNSSLAGASWTRNHLLLNVLEDVKSTLFVVTPGPGAWSRQPLPGAPLFSTVSASAIDDEESDEFFLNVSGYIAPSSLLYGRIGKEPEKLKETSGVLRCFGARSQPTLRDFEGRHARTLLPGVAEGDALRRGASDFALRLWRVRDLDDSELRRLGGPGLA
ncbi:MAG: hypothetical protein L0Z50_37630 [Verrucomicrobiales bacterium]|nr:hypothetical protein [Verrucomicrobiales bacterium]